MLHAFEDQDFKHQGPWNWRSKLQTVRSTVARWLAPPPVRSSYKDTTQIGILAETVLRPSVFALDGGFDVQLSKGEDHKTLSLGAGEMTNALKAEFRRGWQISAITKQTAGLLPQATGRTRIYQSFKPTRAIVDETIAATYSGKGLPDLTLCETPESADDVLLVMAFAGAYNCFPSAPSQDHGISGKAFAVNSLAEISWPMLNSGIDFTMGFAIKPSVLSRATGRSCHGGGLPAGYDPIPKLIAIEVRMSLFGPTG